jgi:shikimate dehydrogenase
VNISGHTRPYAVLGHPIGHTLSPVMHNAALTSLGMDAIYLAFDVEPSRLMKVLTAMADMGFGGINLTVPLKEVAFKGLSKIDRSAHLLGAVNTVEFLPGGMKGHNTDGCGFRRAIKEAFGSSLEGLSVFVIGVGGAGRAIAITCAVNRAGVVAITDVDAGRGRRVVKEIRAVAPSCEVKLIPSGQRAWMDACRKADLVVQATPVGMKKGDKSLLPSAAFRRGHRVFDLVYMYPETAFMKAARKAGATAANGLGMLMHQGAVSFEIWTGRKAPIAVMREALEKAVYGKAGLL